MKILKVKRILVSIITVLSIIFSSVAVTGISFQIYKSNIRTASADSIITISSKSELLVYHGQGSSASFKLTSDIDLEGSAMTFSIFKGTFDGNGHTISNGSQMLFRDTRGATIKDLRISNFTVDAATRDADNYYFGIMIGYAVNNTQISGCEIIDSSINCGTYINDACSFYFMDDNCNRTFWQGNNLPRYVGCLAGNGVGMQAENCYVAGISYSGAWAGALVAQNNSNIAYLYAGLISGANGGATKCVVNIENFNMSWDVYYYSSLAQLTHQIFNVYSNGVYNSTMANTIMYAAAPEFAVCVDSHAKPTFNCFNGDNDPVTYCYTQVSSDGSNAFAQLDKSSSGGKSGTTWYVSQSYSNYVNGTTGQTNAYLRKFVDWTTYTIFLYNYPSGTNFYLPSDYTFTIDSSNQNSNPLVILDQTFTAVSGGSSSEFDYWTQSGTSITAHFREKQNNLTISIVDTNASSSNNNLKASITLTQGTHTTVLADTTIHFSRTVSSCAITVKNSAGTTLFVYNIQPSSNAYYLQTVSISGCTGAGEVTGSKTVTLTNSNTNVVISVTCAIKTYTISFDDP